VNGTKSGFESDLGTEITGDVATQKKWCHIIGSRIDVEVRYLQRTTLQPRVLSKYLAPNISVMSDIFQSPFEILSTQHFGDE
jgi:hypothetical protein